MKVQSVGMTDEELSAPRMVVTLYQDRNGNWWASIDKRDGPQCSHRCTSTYDNPVEALEAVKRL